MAGDIEQLLREAAQTPTRPVDATRLVRRARRQVLLTRAGTAVGSVVVILAAVVLLPSPGEGENRPVIADRPDRQTEATPSEADQPADALWGRTYESVEVAAESTDRRLVDGTRIRLTLTRGLPVQEVEGDLGVDEGADGFATWQAGCNRSRQQVRVAGDELDFGGYGEVTWRLCATEELSEQDRWISEFFNSGPTWRLDEGLLELATNDVAIAFEVADDRADDPHG